MLNLAAQYSSRPAEDSLGGFVARANGLDSFGVDSGAECNECRSETASQSGVLPFELFQQLHALTRPLVKIHCLASDLFHPRFQVL